MCWTTSSRRPTAGAAGVDRPAGRLPPRRRARRPRRCARPRRGGRCLPPGRIWRIHARDREVRRGQQPRHGAPAGDDPRRSPAGAQGGRGVVPGGLSRGRGDVPRARRRGTRCPATTPTCGPASSPRRCPRCRALTAPVPTSEGATLGGENVYAITKVDQERLTLAWSRQTGIPAVALRYSCTYGPRQSLLNPYTGLIAIFATRILNGLPPVLYEDGRQTRDLVFVEDVARANLIAATSGRAGRSAGQRRERDRHQRRRHRPAGGRGPRIDARPRDARGVPAGRDAPPHVRHRPRARRRVGADGVAPGGHRPLPRVGRAPRARWPSTSAPPSAG